MHRRIAWIGALLVVTFLLALPQSSRAATELRLGHTTPTDDAYHIGAMKFVELVSKYTNNAVRIVVFPASQLGGEREMIEAVKLGTLDMVLTTSAPISNFEPRFMLFDLPFLFRDNAYAHQVLDGPIGQKVAAHMEPHGIKSLSWYESGFRNMYSVKKKITSPDDLRGMKFRVMENPVYVSMFRALGASAVTIPSPEIYLSLQTGVVDAYEHPLGPYYSFKAYEVAKLAALTGHTYTPVALLINLKLFNQMPKAHQDAFLRAAHEGAVFERAFIAQNTEEFKAKLRPLGVQFNEVDKRLFQQKMGPVYKEFGPKVGADLIEAIVQSK